MNPRVECKAKSGTCEHNVALDDVPEVFQRTTELRGKASGEGASGGHDELGRYLSACHTRAERVIADTDFFVRNRIREVVLATGHRTDEDRDGVGFGELCQVRAQTDSGRIARES